jgi:hypothetical protein
MTQLSSEDYRQMLIDAGQNVSGCGAFHLVDSQTSSRSPDTVCLTVEGEPFPGNIACDYFLFPNRRFAIFRVRYAPNCVPSLWDGTAASLMRASGEILSVHAHWLSPWTLQVYVEIPDTPTYCQPAWLEVEDLCGNIERGYNQPHCSQCRNRAALWWSGGEIENSWHFARAIPWGPANPPSGPLGVFYYNNINATQTVSIPGGSFVTQGVDWCSSRNDFSNGLAVVGTTEVFWENTFDGAVIVGSGLGWQLFEGFTSYRMVVDLVVNARLTRPQVPFLRGTTAEIVSRSWPYLFLTPTIQELRYDTSTGNFCANTNPPSANTPFPPLNCFPRQWGIFGSGPVLCEEPGFQWSGSRSRSCGPPSVTTLNFLFNGTSPLGGINALMSSITGGPITISCSGSMTFGGALL